MLLFGLVILLAWVGLLRFNCCFGGWGLYFANFSLIALCSAWCLFVIALLVAMFVNSVVLFCFFCMCVFCVLGCYLLFVLCSYFVCVGGLGFLLLLVWCVGC